MYDFCQTLNSLFHHILLSCICNKHTAILRLSNKDTVGEVKNWRKISRADFGIAGSAGVW
jgi:hypothetical protein